MPKFFVGLFGAHGLAKWHNDRQINLPMDKPAMGAATRISQPQGQASDSSHNR